jgi:hypothetical protein
MHVRDGRNLHRSSSLLPHPKLSWRAERHPPVLQSCLSERAPARIHGTRTCAQLDSHVRRTLVPPSLPTLGRRVPVRRRTGWPSSMPRLNTAAERGLAEWSAEEVSSAALVMDRVALVLDTGGPAGAAACCLLSCAACSPPSVPLAPPPPCCAPCLKRCDMRRGLLRRLGGWFSASGPACGMRGAVRRRGGGGGSDCRDTLPSGGAGDLGEWSCVCGRWHP